MLSLEHFKIAEKKVSEYKKLVIGHEPIIEKDDAFLRGIYAINAGTEIFKEFMCFDSVTPEDLALRVMNHKINELKAYEFKKPCQIVKINFDKSGGAND